MKKYIILIIVLILAACSPKEDRDVKSTSQDIKQKSASVSGKLKIPVSKKSSAQKHEFISLNGKWTNIVLSTEHDKFFREDKRSSPDNPDAWFALGKKYWNGYQEVSNAAACYEKAIALQPDALSPRLCYAEIFATQLDIAGAKKAFREAAKYAKTDKEKDLWVNYVGIYVTKYKNKGFDPSWVMNLLKESVPDNPYACKNLALLYLRLRQEDEAKKWAVEGMNSTTNVDIQMMLMQTLTWLRDPADDKEYNELLDKSLIPPFTKIILKMRSKNYVERVNEVPSLSMTALKLAKNMDERYQALEPLMNIYVDNTENLKSVIDKILADQKPTDKVSKGIIKWLQRSGNTNSTAEFICSILTSETNDEKIISLSLSLATIGKNINEQKINELVDRFPSNGYMYAKLADAFKRNEWYDKEILYRRKALELLTRDYEKNAQAEQLIDRYTKFDELDNAEEILAKYANVLSNNASYTIKMSTIYLAKGRTNDAFELLMTNCGKMSHELDREIIIKKLLTFNWPEKNQHLRAANTAEELVEKLSLDIRYSRRESIYKLLIKSYIFLNEPDKALAICKKLFAQGGRVNQFPTVCNLINDPEKIGTFIREMLSTGNTQSVFYSSAAAACEKAFMPELALQLYVKAWKNSSVQYYQTYFAGNAMRLADELKKYSLRDEIINDVIEKCKNGKLPSSSLWNLSNIMRKLNLNEKYEEMLTILIENSKGRKQSSAISMLYENYKRNDNEQGIRDLVNTYYEGKELNINESSTLIDIYFILGEQDKLMSAMNNFGNLLTNSALITMHGSMFVSRMIDLGEQEKALALAKKWINDPDIAPNTKPDLLRFIGESGNRQEAINLAEDVYSKAPEGYFKKNIFRLLMSMYADSGNINKYKEMSEEIINDPNASKWNLDRIARQYLEMNLDDDALMVYDRMLDKFDENDPQRFNVLNRQAELYIKMGDAESAIECALKSSANSPEDPGVNSLLASAYRADGQNKKALEVYCKGIKKSGNTGWQKRCCDQLVDLVQTTDLDFDVSSLATSLLDENRTVQTLITAANLYSISDDINAAERLISEALGKTTIDSQKSKIYVQWIQIINKTGDEKLLDKTMRDYLEVASDDRKAGVAGQIFDLTMKAGDYEKAIIDGKYVLDTIKSKRVNPSYAMRIQKKLAQAYMETGDTENAWKAINQMVESSKQDIYARTDWNTFMKYARELGKAEEATEILEKDYENCVPKKKSDMMINLLNAYKDSYREDDIKKLVAEADKFLENCGNHEKNTLVKFYEVAGQPEKSMEILKNFCKTEDRGMRKYAVDKLYKLYKQNNQLNEALEWAKDQPESTEVNGMIAETYREQGDYEKATKLYQKLVETPGIDRYSKQTYIQQLIKSASKTDDKEKVVNKIIKNIKKENAGSVKNELRQSIQIYQTAEMYDEAVSKIKKAKSLTRNKNEIKGLENQQADCLAKAGEYDDAVKVYNKILQDDSMKWEDRLNYQNKIAKTYNDAHRSDEAKDTAEDIVKTCREFLREHQYGGRAMNARFALAEAYKNSGDKEAARETLEKIQKKYKHTSYAKQAEKKLKDM